MLSQRLYLTSNCLIKVTLEKTESQANKEHLDQVDQVVKQDNRDHKDKLVSYYMQKIIVFSLVALKAYFKINI
jgi:predicted esterase YcpF (UPF0227 family)